MTTLVVEDNPLNMKLITIMLKKLGADTLTAETGEEALNLMKNKSVDCMLLDISLGAGISGITLMQLFRKQEQFLKTPIIAVTVHDSQDIDGYLYRNGFTDYLGKPFIFLQLKETLEKYTNHIAIS